MNCDTTEKNLEMVEDLETSIISAHMKYFGDNSESRESAREQSILYNTVIKYFTCKS